MSNGSERHIDNEGFEYRADFDSRLPRAMLGLDGNNPMDLPPEERRRLANLLLRAGKLSTADIESLGVRIVSAGANVHEDLTKRLPQHYHLANYHDQTRTGWPEDK